MAIVSSSLMQPDVVEAPQAGRRRRQRVFAGSTAHVRAVSRFAVVSNRDAKPRRKSEGNLPQAGSKARCRARGSRAHGRTRVTNRGRTHRINEKWIGTPRTMEEFRSDCRGSNRSQLLASWTNECSLQDRTDIEPDVGPRLEEIREDDRDGEQKRPKMNARNWARRAAGARSTARRLDQTPAEEEQHQEDCEDAEVRPSPR